MDSNSKNRINYDSEDLDLTDEFNWELEKKFHMTKKMNKSITSKKIKKMSKPYNPFNPLKRGSTKESSLLNFKDHIKRRKAFENKINHFNFFPNSRKTSFERGESAGAQLHLVEIATRETTNRVLNNIIELTPKSKNTH